MLNLKQMSRPIRGLLQLDGTRTEMQPRKHEDTKKTT